MARIVVRMFATVREAAGVPSAVVDASDLDELFMKLGDSFGTGLSELLRDAKSDPERLVVLLNGKNIGLSRTRRARLSDGDEIAIFPPVSGG